MTWETVPLRGASVTVSWRKPGGIGANRQLAITISSGVCTAMGLERGKLLVAQRDRLAGKMRFLVSEGKEDGARRVSWKRTQHADVATLFIPMRDVTLAENKPAQLVACEVQPGSLIIRLPSWACPPVRIETGRAA